MNSLILRVEVLSKILSNRMDKTRYMMKFYVLNHRDKIEEIPPETRNVHVAFRPSDKDIFALLKQLPDLKRLHIAPSYAKSLSTSTQMLLDMQDIEIIVSNKFWGHRTDKDQYAVLDETQQG